MRSPVNVNLTSHTVGRWLAPVRNPQKSRSARLFGCKRPLDGSLSLPIFADFGQPQGLSSQYNIKFNSCFRPIFEGAVVFLEQKMTEGFLQNHINSTLQSLRLTFVRHLPLQGRLNMRSPVNVHLTSHTVGRWLAAAEKIN